MRRTGCAALLLIVTVALYAPTLGYGFVYEDLNDPERFLAPPTRASLTAPSRMMTGWTFGLSSLISPVEPMGYHLVSVGVHAVNVLLVFALASMVFDLWPAFVCAALFAVHPIQTEAVAYISARADLVMTTCVILALLCAEREHWLLMLVACVGALAAKESGIVAGPLALLWAMGRWKRIPAWLVGLGSLGLCVGAVYIIAFHHLSMLDLGYTARETAKLWQVLSLVIVPVGFTIDHAASFPPLWPWITLLSTLALGGYALVSARHWSFGVLFVLIALAPRLLTPLVEGLHEHHLYLPTVGLCLALVGSFSKGRYGISEALSQA